MRPFHLLVSEYAVTYLLLAGAAYVCVSVLADRNALGKRLFVAILAFGASAAAGYGTTVALLVQLHLGVNALQEPNHVIAAIAYFLSGASGGLIAWKAFTPST
ncbi:MAG TPA: hypothetical protein VMV57_04905 [Terracidiphilus sp.]|nr:hypothetical protein [Terracidiphilus sp.]